MSFNLHQQVSVLSVVASRIAGGCVGTQKDIQKKATDTIQPTIDSMNIGAWKVVWGPKLWKSAPSDRESAADHTWFVAYNPSAIFEDGNSYDTYVVAIAGTAANSKVDVAEDTDVNVVVDFNQWLEYGLTTFPLVAYTIDSTVLYIAYGVANGVHRLLNVPTMDGVTLSKYLENIPETSRIIFTGHSLGGALSPTVALAAVMAGLIKSPSRVVAYPISGFSPGNGPFADLYANTFPLINTGDNSYQVWNAVIRNPYDIVPHAWNNGSVVGQGLPDILTIYGELPDTEPERLKLKITLALGLVEGWLNASGVPEYVPLQGSKLDAEQPPTPQTWADFLQTALDQHGYPYSDAMGTPVVPPLCEGIPPDSIEAAKQLPVIGSLDKAMEKVEKERTDGMAV